MLKADLPYSLRLFLATGVLGGFTTFSAFSLDAVAIYERGEPAMAALYVAGSVILSIAGTVGRTQPRPRNSRGLIDP